MNRMRKLLVAGAAVLTISGGAWAAGQHLHRMDVALPGGGVAHVRYTGDVAPTVIIDAAPPAPAWPAEFAPMATPMPFAPFQIASLGRMFADIDAQLAAARAAMAQAMPGGTIHHAALPAMPAGATSYSVVMTSDGSHVCTRSTTLIAARPGMQPQLISRSSGDCGAATPTTPDRPAYAAAPAPQRPPATVQRVSMAF